MLILTFEYIKHTINQNILLHDIENGNVLRINI